MNEAMESLRRFCAYGERAPVQGAQTKGTTTQGGFAVGESETALLANHVAAASVMRTLCEPVQVDTGQDVPYAIMGAAPAAKFKAEGAAADAVNIALTGGALAFDFLTSDIVTCSQELLQDSGVDFEREILVPLAQGWADSADSAYTNGTGSSVIEGLTESAIAAVYSTEGADVIGAMSNPYALGRNMIEALPRRLRRGAQFMGTFSTYSALVDALFQAWHRARSGDDPVGAPYYLHRRYIENDHIASSIAYDTARKVASAPDDSKPLFCGDIANSYRIFDAGPFVIDRFADGEYQAKNVIGLRIKRRTTGKLIGPTNCVVHAAGPASSG